MKTRKPSRKLTAKEPVRSTGFVLAREVRTIARMIARHIGYTNGWRVTDAQYQNLCEYAAKRIVARMERRKRQNDQTQRTARNTP